MQSLALATRKNFFKMKLFLLTQQLWIHTFCLALLLISSETLLAMLRLKPLKHTTARLANPFTKFFCKEAFDILENGIINDKHDLLPYGAMLSGIGFGNASTTLGHALSYAFSNEGVPHGYALSSCTTVAHKFNKSTYYERFKRICQKLKFEPIKLKKPLDQAADDIMPDRGHLDNNPIPVTKQDVIECLEEIVTGNPLA